MSEKVAILNRADARCRRTLAVFCLALVTTPTCLAETPFAYLADKGIDYSFYLQKTPRPLRWHHLKIDLSNPQIEVATVVTDDPDGQGPAEAHLESPVELARISGALALINANAFAIVRDAKGDTPETWSLTQPVRIAGLAVAGGSLRSAHHSRYPPIWFDAKGKANTDPPDSDSVVNQAIAGFQWILRDGQVVERQDSVRHPRTAIGIGKDGRYLHLLVVDGRQKGLSEGVTTRELADKLLHLGCHDGMNLDGGGSSVMVLARMNGFLQVVNSPSTKVFGQSVPRPIPVAICIRPVKHDLPE